MYNPNYPYGYSYPPPLPPIREPTTTAGSSDEDPANTSTDTSSTSMAATNYTYPSHPYQSSPTYALPLTSYPLSYPVYAQPDSIVNTNNPSHQFSSRAYQSSAPYSSAYQSGYPDHLSASTPYQSTPAYQTNQYQIHSAYPAPVQSNSAGPSAYFGYGVMPNPQQQNSVPGTSYPSAQMNRSGGSDVMLRPDGTVVWPNPLWGILPPSTHMQFHHECAKCNTRREKYDGWKWCESCKETTNTVDCNGP
ncbi:uncharacterized protein IL334_006363 [Kwoniella shivajii]|uniref:GATA-type domain-containing protein n=1 Tax=Kwoniella shivajii TaxID=564305 RepID=A0ABZ1D7U1_9TREE|nr:hypothetical protein IL334_006363 [Kwoniella shivajii]